jgi:flavin-dependent dehydrogenase
MNYDAIVIGAGPAGSSAALALARQGRAVAIIEKNEFPRRKVCGEFMSATNLDLLDLFGVEKTWQAEAGPEVRRVGLFAAGSAIEAPMPHSPAGGYGRALGRDRLDSILLEAARKAGVDVFQPWHAVSVTANCNAQSVRIVSANQEAMLKAPVIIAAHGSWEQGKLPSQLDRTFGPSDLFGFKAHFRGAQLEPDLMPLLVFPGGYGGMVWSDSGRLSISCCIRRDALAEARSVYGNASAGEAVQKHITTHCRGAREALGDGTLEGSWLAAGPVRPGIRARYANDIFRVGNLAGEAHPLIAEGISMAMQSGWLLASALSRACADDRTVREEIGRQYSALWRRQFHLRINAAGAFARLFALPRSTAIIGPLVGAFPGILTFGAALSGKTKALPASVVIRSSSVVGRNSLRVTTDEQRPTN